MAFHLGTTTNNGLSADTSTVHSSSPSSDDIVISGVNELRRTVAQENTLTDGIRTILNKVDNVDLSSVEQAIGEVKNAVDNIEFPEIDTTELASKDIEKFFGLPAALPEGYEFMTAEEVCSELEEIMTSMDINLTQEMAKEITSNTLNN